MFNPLGGGQQQRAPPLRNVMGGQVNFAPISTNIAPSQFNMAMMQQPPPATFLQSRPPPQQMPMTNLMHQIQQMPPTNTFMAPIQTMPTVPPMRSLLSTTISAPAQNFQTRPPFNPASKPPTITSVAPQPIRQITEKQDTEPEDPFAQSEYAVYETPSDISDDGKAKKSSDSRKRRRSRSRDRERRERKHRRRRSRTRSPNRPTGSGKVYINPAINKLGLTTSVSALLEQSNQQEEKIRKLTEELTQANTRFRGMEAELGNVHDEKMKLKNDLNRASQLATRKTTEVENIRKAESSVKAQLDAQRQRVIAAEKEREAAKQKVKEIEERLETVQAELDFLRGRNEILVKKCEELIEKNRGMVEEKDEALRKVESIQREAEINEHELKLSREHLKRYESDVHTSRNREILWRRDREEMERKLAAKERLIVNERTRLEKELKREKETRQRLEKVIKDKNPEADAITGIELLNRTLDSVKEEIAEQMRSLHQAVTPLQESLEKQVIIRQSERRAFSEPPV